MDRLQIYQGRTLVGVEFAPTPSSLSSICKTAHVFERITITEVQKITEGLMRDNTERGFAAQLPQLLAVANERIGYWERKVPPGSKCFVHHARFEDEQAAKAGYAEARRKFPEFALLGLYSIDPSISMFPHAFPVHAAPNMWRPGEQNVLTKDSMFFLNFFPQQRFLREFVYQGTIAIYSESSPGLYHANNYVDLVSDDFVAVNGVDKFVGVNLNRYCDGHGFFKAVSAGAAKSVIVEGYEQFQWYGILAKLI
jgi:hypothetical protein